MHYFVTIGERTLDVELGPHGVLVEGEKVDAELMEMDGTEVRSLLLDGMSHRVLATRKGKGVWGLHLSGTHLTASVVDERTRAILEMTGSGEGTTGPRALKAPMPGLVVRVEAEIGQEVVEGDGLIIMEAMKMENELKSEGEARIKAIHVQEGQAVEKDQLLVEFDPIETPSSEEVEG
jgi:biotin carboxyl carrier protein